MLEALAAMLVRQVNQGGQLTPEELRAAVARTVARYPTPLQFLARIVRGYICEGWQLDGRKRLGISFDVRISFLVSGYSQIRAAPLLLVTDDNLIHDAARAAGIADRVLRASEYRSLLDDSEAVFALQERVLLRSSV